MIDAESVLFTIIKRDLTKAYPKINISGEAIRAPSSFPHVSMVEIDNNTYTRSLTEQGKEFHANLAYEFNVYSNRQSGRKSECRAIAAIIDSVMLGYNFTRIMLNPIPNLGDVSIYRITSRYRAVISEDGMLYRQ